MSEEMEKQPVQATNAPFRRRRPSRRRGGRRNDSERPPGSFNNDADGDTARDEWPRDSRRRHLCPGGTTRKVTAALSRRRIGAAKIGLRKNNAIVPRAGARTASNRPANRSSAKASSRFPAKVSASCATRNATSFRRRRIFSSRPKSSGVFNSATACGFMARRVAAIAARNSPGFSRLTTKSRPSIRTSDPLKN